MVVVREFIRRIFAPTNSSSPAPSRAALPPVEGALLTPRTGDGGAVGEESGQLLRDDRYRQAIDRGETECLRQIIDEEALSRGFIGPVQHGTKSPHRFTVFDVERCKSSEGGGEGIYFGTNFGERYGSGTALFTVYLNLKNPYRGYSDHLSPRVNDPEIFTAVMVGLKAEYALTDTEADTVRSLFPTTINFITRPQEMYRLTSLSHRGSYDFAGLQPVEPDLLAKLRAFSAMWERGVQSRLEILNRWTGYDGVAVVGAAPDRASGQTFTHDVYVAWFPWQIRSAEPVERNDNGDVILPSDRFDGSSPDIRGALRER